MPREYVPSFQKKTIKPAATLDTTRPIPIAHKSACILVLGRRLQRLRQQNVAQSSAGNATSSWIDAIESALLAANGTQIATKICKTANQTMTPSTTNRSF